MELMFIMLAGYLVGSVPFALVVGKVFYKTDVRQHGSGNLGGGNTGRVLGKKAGLAVMTLDVLKVTFVVALAALLSDHEWAAALGGLAAAVGHCFPIFASFKGGKAVATLYGFLFGTWVVCGYPAWMFFLPLLVFLAVLYVSKIVALSSIVSSLAVLVYACCIGAHSSVKAALAVFAAMIVVRHRKNIERMRKGTENKIKWM